MLSATLSFLFTANLPKPSPDPKPVKILQYADDLILYMSTKYISPLNTVNRANGACKCLYPLFCCLLFASSSGQPNGPNREAPLGRTEDPRQFSKLYKKKDYSKYTSNQLECNSASSRSFATTASDMLSA